MKKYRLIALAAVVTFIGMNVIAEINGSNNEWNGKNTFKQVLDVTGTLQKDGVAISATAAEINTAAVPSARATTASVTNGAVLTLSASTPVVAITGIGGAADTTNTITIAQPYPVGTEFTLYVAAASTNLITIADSTTVLALGAAWVGGPTDVLKILTVATNSAIEVSSSDN